LWWWSIDHLSGEKENSFLCIANSTYLVPLFQTRLSLPIFDRDLPTMTELTAATLSSSSSATLARTAPLLLLLPHELQVHLLTFLRAYDLSALQQTCKYYANAELVHAVVLTTAEQVYPADLTQGFAVTSPLNSSSLYTLGHLRNMEWLVVARVLSRPEPRSGGGFYISKSWCRTALQWLEAQQQRQQQQQQQQPQGPAFGKKPKKLSRKQQKMSRSSLKNHAATAAMHAVAAAGPPEPWPDVNSDLLCCHDQLQRCSNSKSARARRRLVDKQAWKTIQKLYPNSTPLSAVQGECVHCRLELESKKRAEEERVLQMKMQRKQPLNNPVLRRFYTRTRGVPTHCLVQFNSNNPGNDQNDVDETEGINDYLERDTFNRQATGVPLIQGRYYVLPRAWCQAWRRYIKTGDARGNAFSPSSQPPPPPDAASMLCDAHRVPVVPPHLEAYLQGHTNQLFASTRASSNTDHAATFATPPSQRCDSSSSSRPGVVGMAFSDLDPVTLRQLQAAGMSPAELLAQRNAMFEFEQHRRRLQEQQQQQRQLSSAAAAANPLSKQEYLDRENYIVVEILSEDEYHALEGLWPGSQGYDHQGDDGDDEEEDNRRTKASSRSSSSSGSLRGSCDCLPCHVWFDVRTPKATTAERSAISFCTRPCRECEASGFCNMSTLSSASKKLLKH
jgi:hypothetical protein